MNLHCPPSMRYHAEKVFSGEYDLPYQNSVPTILDIGANIGSFAIWAHHRWPNCFVYCYEPLPDNFDMLEKNLMQVGMSNFRIENVAVGNPSHTQLHLGKHNCGEASFFNMGEQSEQCVHVKTIAPRSLPKADMLKMDVEGCEVEILERLPSITYDAVMLEYHSDQLRRLVDELLMDYVLVGSEAHNKHRGIVKYLHKRIA